MDCIVQAFSLNHLQDKPNIQAVIKQEDEDEDVKPPSNQSKKEHEADVGGGGEVIKLVDAQDNQFVLSKGSDSTVPHEDHRLIMVGTNIYNYDYFYFRMWCT